VDVGAGTGVGAGFGLPPLFPPPVLLLVGSGVWMETSSMS
jgi:hypothetical protein